MAEPMTSYDLAREPLLDSGAPRAGALAPWQTPKEPPLAYLPYPPTSLPLRDLLLLEQVPLDADDVVCEVGVGSGHTTARLARACRAVVGLEISAPTVESLRYLERRHTNLTLLAADVTDGAALRVVEGRFSLVVSADTLEHVADPAGFFRGVARLLAPGGRFFVTFPNEPPHLMHGITRFDSSAALSTIVAQAGLRAHVIGVARMRAPAERLAERFGRRPLAAVRRLLRRRRVATAAASAPQTFDETPFFRHARLWRALSPAVNLYWHLLLRRMAAAGPSFVVDWRRDEAAFRHGQIVVAGVKGGG